MSWTKGARVLLFAIGMATASSALAGTIVIRASGPSARSYPPGRSLADGQKIALRAGDTMTLLDTRGTRTLSGPGSFDVGASARAAAAPSALAALIGNAGARQARTGAVRGGEGGPMKPTSLWYIDVAHGGTVCVKDLTRATLWRGDMATPATLTIAQGGQSVPVAFAAGQALRAWPAALPLATATDYRLSLGVAARATSVRLVMLDTKSDAPEDVAAALLARGCQAQLDLLVEAGKPTPDTPPAAAAF